ncbi:hypothetical protein EHQ76_03940 [Leptospira barantonii]|uniref:Alpha/beta hydrolase n=1 Tax=Leptospira barantonii TaxID=2023184 RepID=A0A5F2BQP3_9LEPT|nr:hypothetical protein [Leptospira barantonii]TGM07966.1 hypothetical protein EHQ76_03940 [Leptospira barantonii]
MKNQHYKKRILPFLFVSIFLISTTSSCSRFQKEDDKNSELLTQLGLFSILGCTQYQNAPRVDTLDGLTRIFALPSFTFPCVAKYNDPHLIFIPASSPKNILAVFLPGSGGTPIGVSKIIEEGAARGYHSIGLMYPNGEPINVLCNGVGSSPVCFGNAREEIITGVDKSNVVSVDTNNSIDGRLLKLLQYLVLKRPNDGWGQFLNGDSVIWSKVYFGGHSQGSGHAAYQGKIKTLGRVSIYSGVSDYHIASATPATWLTSSGLTAPNLFYGLIHVGDGVANISGNSNQVTDTWLNAFGMNGALTDADSGTAPFGGTQRLTTNRCSGQDDNSKHNCTMLTTQQAAWDYISFP